MYILLALLTTVSAYMAWQVMRGRGGWIAYGLSTVLALYTHYFAGFIILLENALALGWGLKHRRGRFLRYRRGTGRRPAGGQDRSDRTPGHGRRQLRAGHAFPEGLSDGRSQQLHQGRAV